MHSSIAVLVECNALMVRELQCITISSSIFVLAVMNPKGGPQGMPDTDMHEAKATLSLAYVDVRYNTTHITRALHA